MKSENKNGLPKRGEIQNFEPLTMAELDAMHLETLITYQKDIADEIGYYKGLMERKPLLTKFIANLITLKDEEYMRVDIEIDRLS